MQKYFSFTPSVSLMVACQSKEEVDTKWKALSEDGEVFMPLGEYPFSKRYGWVADRYGLTWQLMLAEDGQQGQKITPNLLFSNEARGRAEEAVQFYTRLFPDSAVGLIRRYKDGEASSSKAQINYAAFNLWGMDFSAMDNGYDVDYSFNEAFSFIVYCQAVSRTRGGAVRLAEGSIRLFLADRSQKHGRNDEKRGRQTD